MLHQSPRKFGKDTSLWTLEMAAQASFEAGLTQRRVSGEAIRATLLARMGVRWQLSPSAGSPLPTQSMKEKKDEKKDARPIDRVGQRQRRHTWAILATRMSAGGAGWLCPPFAHSFSEEGKPLRLIEHSVAKDEIPTPKPSPPPATGSLCAAAQTNVGRRFVEGRPVSAITIRFLSWCSAKLYYEGQEGVASDFWDNAPWHVSKEAHCWIKEHNQKVKKGALEGVRIISCYLPTKSPWLNAMEPQWIHGKRKVVVVEADRLLGAHELADRVCAAFECPHYEHLSLAENAA
jgi:hypothetical protein